MMQKCTHIKNVADKDELQRGIENFVDCTNKWQVSSKAKLCKYIIEDAPTWKWHQNML